MENRNQITKKLWLYAAMIAVMMSCRNGIQMNSNTDTLQQATDTAKSIIINSGTHCFAYRNNNDSVVLSLTIKGKSVTGKLRIPCTKKIKMKELSKDNFMATHCLPIILFYQKEKNLYDR